MNKSTKKILVTGGDMRQEYCAKRLSKTFEVNFTSGGFQNLSDTMSRAFDYIVLPVPTGIKKERLAELPPLMKPDCTVFCGNPDAAVFSALDGYHIVDYMKCEELAILNAVPSAEGAVQIAMEQLPTTIHGQKILVTGYGRISKVLVSILKGLGANITVAARSSEARAWASLAGVKTCNCNPSKLSGDYSLVINTVPFMLFNSEVLNNLRQDVLIIDLASKPGGVDYAYAEKLEIKAIHALGLPGKVAPMTAGNIIADTITQIIKEGC